LGPHLRKEHTLRKDSILTEDNVAMSLMWLGSANGLQLVGDLFGIAKGII
jgi:hypothetical protein